MKRGLALLVAAGLVAVSLFVRSRIDDGGDGGSTATGGSKPVVACVTELADACRAAYATTADLRIEDARTTAEALIAGTAGIDDWVTLRGWPELVALKAPAAGGGSVTPVASTPLVIAAVKDRAQALAASCGDAGWRCLLGAAGRPWTDVGGRSDWGTVKVGLGSRASAVGLLVRASAVAGLASEGVDVGTNDPDYETALSALDRADGAADPLSRFFLVFPATYAAVGTTAAQLEAGVGTYRDRVTSTPPEPATQAIAVIATGAGKRAVDAGRLAAALTHAQWTAPPAADAVLPDPGVLLALSGI